MAGNGRKWSKMDFRGYLVENGFSRVSRRGHRGDQEDHGKNGRKWQKMVEKSSPRLFGRKWTSRAICAIPLLLHTSSVQSFNDILDDHDFVRIINYVKGERLEIYFPESEKLLYHGEFNEKRERE